MSVVIMQEDDSHKPKVRAGESREDFDEERREITMAFRPYVMGYEALVKKLRAEGSSPKMHDSQGTDST